MTTEHEEAPNLSDYVAIGKVAGVDRLVGLESGTRAAAELVASYERMAEQANAPYQQMAAMVEKMNAPYQQIAAQMQKENARYQQVAAMVEKINAPYQQMAEQIQKMNAPYQQMAEQIQKMNTPYRQVVAQMQKENARIGSTSAAALQLSAMLGDTSALRRSYASSIGTPEYAAARRLVENDPRVAEVIARTVEPQLGAQQIEYQNADGELDVWTFTEADRIVAVLFVLAILLSIETWLFLVNREVFDYVNGTTGTLAFVATALKSRS